MQFIMTNEEILVPVSQIKHIGRRRKREGDYGGFECPVITIDGDSYAIPADEVDKLSTTVISALPGYELITSSSETEEEFAFCRTPIIAWRISPVYGNPSPVTVGDNESYEPQAILTPDGQIEIQCDRTFDNLAGWEKHARERHAEAYTRRQIKEKRG
jgi:hypothetical protein